MKITIFVILMIGTAAFALPAGNPNDEAEIISTENNSRQQPQQRPAIDAFDQSFQDFDGVIETGAGYPFYATLPNINPFGFFDYFQDSLRRLREGIERRVWSEVAEQEKNLEGNLNLDSSKANKTSVIKVIDGHKIEINDTVYTNQDNNDGHGIFKVRVIQVRPLDSSEEAGSITTTTVPLVNDAKMSDNEISNTDDGNTDDAGPVPEKITITSAQAPNSYNNKNLPSTTAHNQQQPKFQYNNLNNEFLMNLHNSNQQLFHTNHYYTVLKSDPLFHRNNEEFTTEMTLLENNDEFAEEESTSSTEQDSLEINNNQPQNIEIINSELENSNEEVLEDPKFQENYNEDSTEKLVSLSSIIGHPPFSNNHHNDEYLIEEPFRNNLRVNRESIENHPEIQNNKIVELQSIEENSSEMLPDENQENHEDFDHLNHEWQDLLLTNSNNNLNQVNIDLTNDILINDLLKQQEIQPTHEPDAEIIPDEVILINNNNENESHKQLAEPLISLISTNNPKNYDVAPAAPAAAATAPASVDATTSSANNFKNSTIIK